MKKKIVVIEDNEDYAETIAEFINLEETCEVVGVYHTAEDALENIEKDNPEIVFMDIDLPMMNGIVCTREIKKLLPNTSIIILSVLENSTSVFDALCSGATGYLTKNATREKLIEAIDEIGRGGSPMSMNIARMVVKSFEAKKNESILSERETEVLVLLSDGKSYKGAANELSISTETVKSHIKNIYQKLQVSNKVEAIMKAKDGKMI